MAGRRLGRGGRPRRRDKDDEQVSGTEFAEREEGVEDDPDARAADEVELQAKRAYVGEEAPQRRAPQGRHRCPVCETAFHEKADVQAHLETYGNPGFGVGDEVRNRKRPSLIGAVTAVAPDHQTFEMGHGKFLVAAFDRLRAAKRTGT